MKWTIKKRSYLRALASLGSAALCAALLSSLHAHEITIQSSNVHYEGDLITLSGTVELQSSLGKVTAEKAWLRRDEKKQSDIAFPWAELQCNVHVELSDGGQLRCSLVKLDHLKEVALFFGTPRITYIDSHGTISAQEAEMEYTKNENSLEPSKITLYGSVVLKKADRAQYALADRVEYFPAKKELLFHAEEGNRVLFFDKEREMQLSAPAVKALDNGEVIEGLGEVRFYFKNTELQKLKEQFQWEGP